MALMRKQASAAGDFLRNILGTGAASATVVGYPAAVTGNAIGGVTGQLPEEAGKAAAIKKLVDYENNKYLSYVPGVGIHRVGRRGVLLNQILAKKDVEHDSASKLKYKLLSALNPLNLVAAPFAGLAAALTDKRSLAEHKEFTDAPHLGLKSILIPGWRAYNDLKAIGASDRVSELHDLTDEDLKKLDPEVIAELKRLQAAKKAEGSKKSE